MPRWDSVQYLRFERERAVPCVDLVRRIELESPRRIVDLGCGPGTSARILRARWPGASVLGVDSSGEMLRGARAALPDVEWAEADLATWTPGRRFELVFSNAALQWLPDHPHLLPRLWSMVATDGALAFQVPAPGSARRTWSEPLDQVLALPAWRARLTSRAAVESVLPADAYYDLLSPSARRVDLWDTEYLHVLSGPEAVVEWTKGTALRPLLEQLPVESEQQAFLADYRRALTPRYPRRPDGRVLFPFLRRFVIAYR
ncbi:MAG TPA: methyltransferase domain-containing protein [Thermoplasmata archaeon]|nr:methyltransferase domain-containing protein [Thermoplasmata archaeon]